MAIMHSDTINVENVSYGLADALYNLIRKYSDTDKFSHEAGSNVITFDGCQVNFNNNVVGVKNGDEVVYNLTSAYTMNINPVPTITVFSDSVFLFFLNYNQDADDKKALYVFITNGTNKLVGFNQNKLYYDMNDNFVFLDLVSLNDTTYKPQKMLSISSMNLQSGLKPASILVSDKALFTNSSGNGFLVDDLKACSQIAAYSVVTIKGKNHLALGSQLLIEVES